MISVSSNRIVIFSKSADPGNVKTRLHSVLSPEKCLSFHISLLKDTLYKVRDFSAVLYLAGSGYLPFDPEVPIRYQTGVDLGNRMSNAFAAEFEQHSKVVIIGTDSPTFPASQIALALSELDRHDVVLGPCDDGGYYLVGLRRLIPAMFAGVPWSTPDVLNKTLEKISGYSYLLLDPYFDVDLPDDLMRLKDEIERENGSELKHIREWISDYFGPSAR